MKTLPAVALSASFLAACGVSPDFCECHVTSSSGDVSIACGAAMCVDGAGSRCSANRELLDEPAACSSCTPSACETRCGDVSDGCGGTLHCVACGSLCANVTCTAGHRCDPGSGACIADPCAGLVCGSAAGATCGSCPSGSTCASTQRACVQSVATLPGTDLVISTAVVNDTLYLRTTAFDLYALALSTSQLTLVAPGAARSPLAVKGTDLYFTDTMGLRRLAVGSTTSASVPGLSSYCDSLLVSGASIYCGVGGDPEFGVDSFGIEKLPIGGGTASWVKTFLNYPQLAVGGGYLFYVGTTDNYGINANLGALDLASNADQVVVSGGSLDSRFIMTDAHAWYYVRHDQASTSTLVRNDFATDAASDLITGDGIFPETTVIGNGELFVATKVGTQSGVWRVPLSGGAGRELLLDTADVGSPQYGLSAFVSTSAGQIVISDQHIYRAFAPGS